jgi:hypothetical protein
MNQGPVGFGEGGKNVFGIGGGEACAASGCIAPRRDGLIVGKGITVQLLCLVVALIPRPGPSLAARRALDGI